MSAINNSKMIFVKLRELVCCAHAIEWPQYGLPIPNALKSSSVVKKRFKHSLKNHIAKCQDYFPICSRFAPHWQQKDFILQRPLISNKSI